MKSLHISILAAAAAVAGLAPHAAAQAALYDLRGQANTNFGRAVAGVGDVDGDGVPDIAIGASNATGLQQGSGAVFIRSGADAHTIRVLQGEKSGDLFGWAVASTADVDGDGVRELIVGAPGVDVPALGLVDAGRVYLFSGATGQLIWSRTSPGSGDLGGYRVAGLDDVSGDGKGDVAWAAHRAFSGTGLVRVTSGASPLTFDFTLHGENPGDFFGLGLDNAGDVDGDGIQDLIVGAPRWSNKRGKVYVFSGVTLGLSFSIPGGTPLGQFGFAVAGVGDQDGDGLADVAVGEPFGKTNGVTTGRLHVIAGGGGHAVLANLIGAPDSLFGWSVAGLGDVDGDGRWELIVGAPLEDPFGFPNRGAARVIDPISSTTHFASYGSQDGDQMGTVVAAPGDLNGDGFADFIAATPVSDGNGVDSGWVHVVLSSAPSPVAYCTAKVNSAGCTPKLGYVGCPSASISDYFHLIAYDVLPFQPGILFYGLGAAAIPFQGGTLCVAPPTVRLPVLQSGGNGADPCSGLYDQSFAHAQMSAAGATPGTHLYFQCWSRDPGFAPPQNSGLTNGLDVLILP